MPKFRSKWHVARWKTDIHGIYPQTAGPPKEIEKIEKGKNVWFFVPPDFPIFANLQNRRFSDCFPLSFWPWERWRSPFYSTGKRVELKYSRNHQSIWNNGRISTQSLALYRVWMSVKRSIERYIYIHGYDELKNYLYYLAGNPSIIHNANFFIIILPLV